MSKEKVNLEEWEQIGEGKTSIVYRPKDHRPLALKVYFDPDDGQFTGDADAARKTLRIMQSKLVEIRKLNLPYEVVAPQGTFEKKSGKIIGYSMTYIEGAPLEKYGDALWREKMKINHVDFVNNIILPVFKDLHRTVSKLHEANVVIGDFSGKNVLVKDKKAYIIDADSFQFYWFDCEEMQDAFKDPLIIDLSSDDLNIKKGAEASKDTDWYAYNVLLMESLLLVKPYGGKYKPNKYIKDKERLQKRITIFDNNVKIPSWAIPYDRLPDDLIQYFKDVFVRDKRGEFPSNLLNMRWKRCPCGIEHARILCPNDKEIIHSYILSPDFFSRRYMIGHK